MTELVALSTRIGAKLKETGQTVAVAESLTAGKLADALASVSGSSGYFRGGVTAYHIDIKVNVLAVERELAEACNCVSNAVAHQMAEGVRRMLDTDIGIATTGYAEPPEDGEVPYAFFSVLIGSAGGQGMVQGEGLSREEMRVKVATEALKMLAMMLGA